jgi:hypothetical protein
VSHIAQLKKAQATINVQIKQQQQKEQAAEVEDLMNNIKMRPNTPVFNDFR